MQLNLLKRLTFERGAVSYNETVLCALHVFRVIQELKQQGYTNVIAQRGSSQYVMELPQFPEGLPVSQNAPAEHIAMIEKLIKTKL